jgi:hypothetical protein
MTNIDKAIKFAKTLINVKYKWWKGEDSTIDEPFWAENDFVPSLNKIKSVNCTGLINLMRRYVGLEVPGVKEKYQYAGGTWIWYKYLNKNKRIRFFDISKRYPKGTLLIRKYKDIEDQGHVAVIITDNHSHILYEKIIHSYSEKGVSTTTLGFSHFSIEDGYYTHVCMPDDWLNK